MPALLYATYTALCNAGVKMSNREDNHYKSNTLLQHTGYAGQSQAQVLLCFRPK